MVKTIGNPNYGNVNCILQDKAGTLWFGTTQNGLYAFDGDTFTRYLMADGLSSNEVYSLYEDKQGNFWVGTGKGLCLYTPNKGSGRLFSVVEIPLPKDLPPNTNPSFQGSHWVYDIVQSKDGKIWFATLDGVFVYDAKNLPVPQGEFSFFSISDDSIGFLTQNDKAERILEDTYGNIWFGGRTQAGMFRFNGKTLDRIIPETLYQSGPKKPKPHNWGWPQLQDKNGNIWFSNWGGVYCYNGKTFTSYSKKEGLPGIITCILQDSKGNLWFGGDGFFRFDPNKAQGQGKSFTRFTPKSGYLPGVWVISEDKNGNIWVGTRETSLFLFDGETLIPYSEYAH